MMLGRAAGDRGPDGYLREQLREQSALACCKLLWPGNRCAVGAALRHSLKHQTQAVEQKIFIGTLGFLQNTRCNIGLDPYT